MRPFYRYRELGVAAATRGLYKAQHVQITGSAGPGTGWHCHDLNFQLVYVIAGFVRFQTENHGEVILKAGDSAYLPPFMLHDEVEFSPDFEVLEVTSPAQVVTLTQAPREKPDRGPSRFSASHLRNEDFLRGSGPRAFLEYRDLGVTEASGRRAQAQVVRTNGPFDGSTGWHYHELDFQFVYVLEGWVTTELEGLGMYRLERGDAMNVPARRRHDVTAFSSDFTVLEINFPADFETIAG
jgi:quercetin dioxygenase-like cupin family protein